jgi:hydrogenase nickel incorporation protein HypA/HybF
MHEMSIALSLLEAVEEQAHAHGDARVQAVHLKIGRLSGVLPDALRGAFELACEGTNFENCRLKIEETPVMIRCPKCAAERPVASIQQMACAVCGTATADITRGRELEVCAMEICQ